MSVVISRLAGMLLAGVLLAGCYGNNVPVTVIFNPPVTTTTAPAPFACEINIRPTGLWNSDPKGYEVRVTANRAQTVWVYVGSGSWSTVLSVNTTANQTAQIFANAPRSVVSAQVLVEGFDQSGIISSPYANCRQSINW